MEYEGGIIYFFKKEISKYLGLMEDIVEGIFYLLSGSEKKGYSKYSFIYKDLIRENLLVQRRVCRVGIAQIGLSNSDDFLKQYYQSWASGLLWLRKEKVKIIRSKMMNMIESAHKSNINLLLFPELAIDLNFSELIEDVSNLATKYKMYIVPGSFHDRLTRRNLSLVFGPEGGILWEQEKLTPAYIRIKKEQFKEKIKVSLPRKVIVCNTEYGRIAILICRDFLDMDLRVGLKNFEPPVDIILNPSFTPFTADFHAAHVDARRSIYAYCCFANIGQFGNSQIYCPEKERVKNIIPSKKEGLILKDIDLFKLRSERKKWEVEKTKDNNFIQSTK